MKTIKTKKDFLKKETFLKLKDIIVLSDNTFPFYFNNTVSTINFKSNNDFYFTHTVYKDYRPYSDLFEIFKPVLQQLNVKSLIRIKINLYTRTEKIHYHDVHKDYPFDHNGCILALNTCNGGTQINKKLYQYEENQALFFNPSIPHCSTTCTNAQARFNINFNYF